MKMDIQTSANMCINTIRAMGAELPQLANSGHPGAPMGLAPMAYTLWGHIMNYSSKTTNWINRDRFILSNGHSSALQYSMLHLTGYKMSLDDLKNFRKLNSNTPGHPESHLTEGVEVCTGPLGQGVCNAVGLAMGAHHMCAKYNMSEPCSNTHIKNVYKKAQKMVQNVCKNGDILNTQQSYLYEQLTNKYNAIKDTHTHQSYSEEDILFDHNIYCIVGDGCLQEGVSSEASSLAGHLGLNKLIVLYDDNEITIDGSTNLSFTEDVKMRYKSYGWNVISVTNGDTDWLSIYLAILNAQAQSEKPTIICVKTTIGFGSKKQGTEKVHGAPLGEEDIKQFKKNVGLNSDKFLDIPDHVYEIFGNKSNEGNEMEKNWQKKFNIYKQNYPEKYNEITQRISREIPHTLISELPTYTHTQTSQAGRAFSGICLNMCANYLPELIGGSADLTGSNATTLKNEGDFQKGKFENRYIRFGVREHAMAAICNGLATYGAFRPFCSTFLNFITYAWGAVRLSALSGQPVLYICTHDSIEMGEDGPTHQPIEVLPLLRATPNLLTMRPADGNEVSGCYSVWLKSTHTPVVLALCRSGTPHIEGSNKEAVEKGAYIISDFNSDSGPKIILGASGTELAFCVQAKELLIKDGFSVRIVSFPCWELFEQTDEIYKNTIFPTHTHTTNMYVEASNPLGWSKYFKHYIGMDTFGASAPKAALHKHFGFTPENIYQQAKQAATNDKTTH